MISRYSWERAPLKTSWVPHAYVWLSDEGFRRDIGDTEIRIRPYRYAAEFILPDKGRMKLSGELGDISEILRGYGFTTCAVDSKESLAMHANELEGLVGKGNRQLASANRSKAGSIA